MNLADYLSELLGLYDEVSVPGLGCFMRVRVNAHYNEKEARFYPPYHQVKFVPQPKDDDIFTQYIADKKNISLASSKYFAEKFISKLKEDAARGKFLFADLGAFQTEQDQLVFKPNEKIPTDPAFYGYPQVNLYKLGQPLHPEHAKPVFAGTNQASPMITPTEQAVEQSYYEEEAEPKRGLSIWLILLIALGVLVVGLFAVYKFYPQAFDKAKSIYHSIVDKKDAAVPAYSREVNGGGSKQSETKSLPAKTSAVVTSAVDTVNAPRFEVIGSQSKSWPKENVQVEYFRSLGLDAKIVTGASTGPLIKVSVGTYATQEQADSARQALIKAGKISNRYNILEIKPKK